MRVPKWALGLLLGCLGLTAMARQNESPSPTPRAKPSTPGPGPIHVSGGVMAGNLLHMVHPVYSKCLGPVGSGVMLFHAVIGEDGLIKSLEVISVAEPLRQPALDAIRQWIYRPYLLNGKPIAVETTIMMDVQLNGSTRC